MDEAYYSGNLESVLGYSTDMHAELVSISQLIIAKIETIDNDILNNDIVDFIMCRSNLDNPFIAFLDTVYTIIDQEIYQTELINSLDDDEIIDCIVNKFMSFYKDNLENIVDAIITLKYIMNNPDFKTTYAKVLGSRIADIDIKQVIRNNILQLSNDIRERYL
ncbi:putative phosphotransferase protein [Akhmeta virus]|uniref:Phosphotransferase/anion transport protein n=1 Tax=Orthopoxvirus akhmetapox TaxID=2200830 RepID=A0A346FSE5_9POXV|nr:putative phosphotransferase protein [Akhmeta virus]AXN74968.1 putative phosphotransferase protein [Akhmeta virus]AXN75188.1 putative phosphotransferase protein [Akhmeta virus]QEQ49514.1 Putative phosphotransferase/anion transport protein [Akhmeta virus]